MFYILEPEKVPGKTPHASLTRERGVLASFWVRGRQVDPSELKLPLEISCEKYCVNYPDLMDVGLAAACSPRFKKVIEESVADNIQFFPVLIQDGSGNVRDDYFLFNVIGRVSVVDMDASDYTDFEGEIFRLNSLALRIDIPHLDMLRVDEYDELIIVSERIRHHLEAAALTGVRLVPAEGWNDHHRF